jgi:hypothetical protein
MYGVFNAADYILPEPTKEAALSAMAMIDDVMAEFRFAQPHDRSAAISASFTGAVRPTLPYAPGFLGTGPVSGSGKSYLLALIGLFAGPAANKNLSYTANSEEMAKALLSAFMTNPSVLDYDEVTGDLYPFPIICRALTSEEITERILGVSKMATVSTRSLFLFSGNNVRVLRDLCRRIISIVLDPRCQTPTTIQYQGSPVETVRKNRAAYVSAVLTVILAWRAAGSPRAAVPNIATYGLWADYARHPLIWLGYADPATSMLEQVTVDPDSDALGALLIEWYRVFGSKPTTVRKVIEKLRHGHDRLRDAIHDLAVVERGEISPGKLGIFIAKNVNRIVGDSRFIAAMSDGRKAWAVDLVGTPAQSVAAPATPAPQAPDVDDDIY